MKFLAFFFSFFVFCTAANAQTADTLAHAADTPAVKLPARNIYQELLDSNHLVNIKSAPQEYPQKLADHRDIQPLFFIMAALVLCLGLLRSFFSRYFNTLFRVFFNTSLRQNQLTDQLTQAKLPSLSFNLFFVVVGGIYLYFLMNYFFIKNADVDWRLLQICIVAVAVCYLIKFLSLKLMGWITGYSREADTYIFVIFLFNKIEGIILLPFAIIMIFSSHIMISGVAYISVFFLALVMILRFFRSWSLLQSSLKVSAFHFLVYIFALEVLPIAFIYKAARLFFGIIQ